MGENKAASPSSTLAAESALSETKTVEEYEMEFEADVTKSVFGLLSGNSDVGNPSDTGTVLTEHLENGECEKFKVKEHASEASISNLNLPDTLIDKNGAARPLDTVAVLEGHLGNGEREESKVEEDAAEASISNLNLPDTLIDENGAARPLDTVAVLEGHPGNGDCKEPKIGTQDREEEHHLDSAALICSSLEGETEYLPSSKQSPLEAGKSVIQLQCESSAPGAPNGVCTVNIVGTIHVSKASCEEVKALIRHVKPEVVFLELCSSRTNLLLPWELKVPTFSSMLESYRKKEMNLFGLIYSWFFAKVGERLEVLPGTEFRVAYEEAVKYGASVTLGDRPVHVTLKRTWRMMSTWHKIKFFFGILTTKFDLPSVDELQALVGKMEENDELTLMIQKLSKSFPSLSETLVVERDLYMVAKLRTVARRYSSVVAVVGRGHLSGIAKHWKEDINVEELLTIPAKSSSNRKWFWGSLALGVGGIAVGAYLLRHR